jgi:DNA replication and repair protein RecF
MKIHTLTLENYRNVEHATVEFSDGVNLIYGNNAQGKTNALEAIYYFSRGKSFRGAKDSELVRDGGEFFSIGLFYTARDKERTLSYKMGRHVHVREKNGVGGMKASEMIGDFRSVLFCPEDLSLVKAGPDARRGFLNVAVAQAYPLYIVAYQNYKKALDERNSLLKMAQKNSPFVRKDEIEVWSERLYELSLPIYLYRRKYIERLSEFAPRFLFDISEERERLGVAYETHLSDGGEGNELLHKLSENIDKEILAGHTLYGPHRDDLLLSVNGKDSRIYASQGQQRSIVLSLKMAEGEVSRVLSDGEYPVFLYDDVLSELDARRKDAVLSYKDGKQTVVTACDEDIFRHAVKSTIYTEGGTYVSAYRKR